MRDGLKEIINFIYISCNLTGEKIYEKKIKQILKKIEKTLSWKIFL